MLANRTTPKRVIVCGGRHYSDYLPIYAIVGALPDFFAVSAAEIVIVHGGAQGADLLAAKAAHQHGFATEAHHAEWRTRGKAAGPMRNQEMLDCGADLVVAFPGGVGTADMVQRATKAGVAVLALSAARQSPEPLF